MPITMLTARNIVNEPNMISNMTDNLAENESIIANHKTYKTMTSSKKLV